MRQKIRSYLVFAPFLYKAVMLIVVPVVLLGLQMFSAAVFQGTGIPLFIVILVLLEVVADNWFLGGIQEKNSEKIDYLKTSPTGMKIITWALTMDLVRRLLTAACVYGLSALISRMFGARETLMSPGELLLAVLLTYVLSVLGTFISRFASLLWLNLLIGYIGSIAGLILFIVGGSMPGPVVAMMNIGLAVLGGGLSVLTVKIAMLRMEGSYYDK